ncbi:AraC family transcriptional regulator [Streptomyces sp. Edi2]|uniref:AraC family transcriptional regulator n=1 Tax=Streptomyces sp. Edi2 TaxID=3162528 RepID=UPI003305A176
MELLVRSTNLNGYLGLVRSLDADPVSLVRSVGLDPADLADQDSWVPISAAAELLERTAQATRCHDFGLRLAEVSRFSNIGPVGLAAREEPDVRSALALLIQYLHLYNEALQAHITETNGLAKVSMSLDLDTSATRRRQAMELLVGVCHHLLRNLIAPEWNPVSVHFTHAAPADLTTHHRALGPTIAFEQDVTAVSLYATDLDAPNRLSDPQLALYTRQLLRDIPTRHTAPLPDRARRIIEALLPTGRCSIGQLARALDVDARTVQRHLARTGDTYCSLLDAVRTDLARRHVARRNHPLTEVAGLLGFSGPAAFSRWFHTRFGTSPSTWRTAIRTTGAPPPPEVRPAARDCRTRG